MSKVFAKEFPKRILSVDASTASIAFALFDGPKLERYGKVKFVGDDAYYKAGDASLKCLALLKDFNAEAVVIESVPFINSPRTALQLALVQGSIIGAARACGITTLVPVTPTQWQNHIGNPPLTKAEKASIMKEFPNKSKSWYQTKSREIRKQRTIDYINFRFGSSLSDNDVTDAIGIGCFAVDNQKKVFGG